LQIRREVEANVHARFRQCPFCGRRLSDPKEKTA
jgi:hypothetical protein